ncbi:MAG: D-xylose transport system substrate-binding protein [Nocardioidaceae bacterium]|jgi:D-xylose transport system substrate-binding protein|nr:D-xylose transport system substrate-binding protein [Nocardioidaceae bacterium]
MRKTSVSSLAVLGIAAAMSLTACGSSSNNSSSSSGKSSSSSSPSASSSSSSSSASGTIDGKGAKVGIILPDTTSSPRWVTADPTALKADCQKFNLDCNIQNAGGSASKMQTIARQMESNKIKVLMIVDLDAASGAKIEQEAAKNGVIPVDYDRLTPGGGAALYVSFDNVKVGQLQGQTLASCPQVKGQKKVKYVEIDGAATDNNATLFHQGYDGVLSKTPGWTKVAEQDGNWVAPTAGRQFSAMLGKNPDIKAAMVANDTMAGAVITDLQRQSLNGQVAVSGQDATAEGLQHVMDGDQCFTIYKASALEADPAIKAIAQLANGTPPDTKGVTITDPQTKKKVPSILATPVAITKANVATPINDQYTPKDSVCKGKYVAECAKAGVK